MGLWKILVGVLIGVCMTESGRESIIKIGKQILEIGQDITDKSCSAVEIVKNKASECADQVQSQAKELVENVQSKSKQSKEENGPRQNKQ